MKIKRLTKALSVLLSAVMIATSASLASAATPDTVQAKLAAIEKDTYGSTQTGAVMDRINKLEKDYNASHRTGSMMARVDALYNDVYTNSTTPSVLADLNAIEWNISHEVSMESVEKRVADMEMTINGKTSEGTYRSRIAALSKASFGSETLPLEQTAVPANTLVKVALVEDLNAKNLKVGDIVSVKIADDVIVDGKLVFAKGSPGEGKVTKVSQAKNFGRNAKLEVDFYQAKSIDGTDVTTFIGDEAKTEMKNLAMAAGASLAGMLILGPIGIIGGAFVNGKNIEMPAGTELYIQTKDDTTLYGVLTTAG